jgi:hypothetical protein
MSPHCDSLGYDLITGVCHFLTSSFILYLEQAPIIIIKVASTSISMAIHNATHISSLPGENL